MKKITVTVNYDDEKMNAIRVFLTQKNLELDTELEGFMEQLFKRYVPKNVQEYLELKDTVMLDKLNKKPSAT